MQPKDKNDSIQLSTRYEQYCFAKRHLRGERRPKVFPITGNNPEDNEIHERKSEIASTLNATYSRNQSDAQYIATEQPQAFRVRGIDGVSSTLQGEAGGTGAKTGLYAMRAPLKFLSRNQKKIEGDYAFTVDGANTGGVQQDMKIRRLTPTECCRLQGFSDNWVDGISDSQKYKCLGNAVTTNVITEIGKRLLLSIDKL